MLIYWAYVHSILARVNRYSECTFFKSRFYLEVSANLKISVMCIYLSGGEATRCVMNINAFNKRQENVMVRPHINLG